MSYQVKLDTRAADELAEVPVPLRRSVHQGILALGIDPTGLSRPDPNPAAQGQLYEFSFLFDDMECWVQVVFQYGADEQTIHVSRVRWEVL